MSHFPPDIRYACALLGLAPGASLRQVEEVRANVQAYRFATRVRREKVERLADFLFARDLFGTPDHSFDMLRKAYYRKAKDLHPDTNKGNDQAVELLKKLNAAFEVVEAVHRESQKWLEINESDRRDQEAEARRDAMQEARAQAPPPRPSEPSGSGHPWRYERAARREPPRPSTESGAQTYMAASVPRYIRNARLFYLGRDAVIGSRMTGQTGSTLVYDIIMLPEREFLRARANLALEGAGIPDLSMSRLTPAYIPVDTQEVSVPPDEPDPHSYARNHFVDIFGLHRPDTSKSST